MGQKVNAHGFRVGVSKPWDAKWYAEKDYAALLNEDVKIRDFLKKQLFIAGVSRIEIERSAKRIKLIIHTAKPGMVIFTHNTTVYVDPKLPEGADGK